MRTHTRSLKTDSGFFWARPDDFVKDLLLGTIKVSVENALNEHEGLQTMVDYHSRYVTESNAGKMGYLSKALFPSGFTLKWMKLNQVLGICPMIVHMNWTAEQKDKKAHLQKYGLWFVGDEFVY